MPDSLGSLTALEYFYGQYYAIIFMEHTVFFYVNNNQLQELPTTLGHLTSVKVLYAGQNSLSAIPTEIGLLSGALFLKFDVNRLSSIPSELFKITNLLELFKGTQRILQNNRVTIFASDHKSIDQYTNRNW